MGFRSTFTTEHVDGSFSSAFVSKWQHVVNFRNGNELPLSAKKEAKISMTFDGLDKEIQAAFSWPQNVNRIVLIWLHECGGISRVEIHRDSILYSEPTEWDVAESLSDDSHHGDWCSRCSDVEKARAQ
jgi:hypothetical protein